MTSGYTHTGGGWSVVIATGDPVPSALIDRATVEPVRPRGPLITTAIEAYFADCRQRGHSTTTLTAYSDFLEGKRAKAFLDEHHVEHLGDLTPEMLRGFQNGLRTEGLAAATRHTHFRTWRSFLRWCAEQEGWLREDDRLLKLKPPKLEKKEPGVITEVEEAYLLGAAHCERDRFLIRFLIRTGLRRAEVSRLNVDDILVARSGAHLVRVIHGKGGKDRKIPLDTGGSYFSDEVSRYIANVRPRSPEPALFLTLDNVNGWGGWSAQRRGNPTRLSLNGIYQVFRRLHEETGIIVTPHRCRHTFATRAIAAGVPAFALQHALGHTTLAMTQRYVHYSTTHLEAAWAERRD